MNQASQDAWQDAVPPTWRAATSASRRAPRVSVQAFCETVETAAAIQAAGEDRRMAKAHLRIQMGGLIAAIEAYQNSPTPNVIILESENRGDRYFRWPRSTRPGMRLRNPRHYHRPHE